MGPDGLRLWPAAEWLRPLLIVAGALEVGLFGLPLMFFGQYIQPFVRHWDPHIYKEYGVARIVFGIAFLLAARRDAGARRFGGIVALLFYGLNIAVSLFDLATGNVARIEWAVVLYSLVLATGFAAATARGR